jgi:CheY-like chemotaxis protein
MAPTATATPNAEAASEKKHRRVLYADDMRELRDVMHLSLTREGYATECVSNGELALQRLAADPDFDLVITDHHMPAMNGLEFITRLRATPFRGKIMVFSSELSPVVAAEYHKLHVDRILYKPVYPSELRKVLAEVFSATVKSATP